MFQKDLADRLSILAIELRYAAGDCREPGLRTALLAMADAIDHALV